MKLTQFLFVLLWSSSVYSQETRFRFETAFSLQTITYFGTIGFNEVLHDDPYSANRKYQFERYNTKYKSFSTSLGFNYKVGVNWLNSNSGHVLRSTASLFFEIYKEEAQFELIDYEVGDTNLYPNPDIPQDIQVGYAGSTVMQGIGVGVGTELIYLYKLDEISIGGGVSYVHRYRWDEPVASDVYAPVTSTRSTYRYITDQIGLTFQIEKTYDRWKWFTSLNQAIFTVKKYQNKGAAYFPDNRVIVPVSQNLDFRFPLTWQLGVTLQFDKIKR